LLRSRTRDVQPDRITLARAAYEAYAADARDVVDELLAEDFVFYSPPDPGIEPPRLPSSPAPALRQPVERALDSRAGGHGASPPKAGHAGSPEVSLRPSD
jgi:hypothetical protein